MNQQVVIRAANKSDGHELTHLTNQMGYPSSESTVFNILEKVIGQPDQQVFVAQINDTVVGYVHLVVTHNRPAASVAEIAAMVVHESFRGRGVGSALLRQSRNWGEDKGIGSIRIRSRIIRESAYGFFEHHGFGHLKTQQIFIQNL